MGDVADESAPPIDLQAGPVDDTIDYIDCVIRRLMGIPCVDGIRPEPVEPIEPIEPVEPIVRI